MKENNIFDVRWEQINELAAATNTTPVGFLINQHLMVLLSKLFLRCLINIALDWHASTWYGNAVYFSCALLRGLAFFLTTFTLVTEHMQIKNAAVCYKVICSCQPLSQCSGFHDAKLMESDAVRLMSPKLIFNCVKLNTVCSSYWHCGCGQGKHVVLLITAAQTIHQRCVEAAKWPSKSEPDSASLNVNKCT